MKVLPKIPVEHFALDVVRNAFKKVNTPYNLNNMTIELERNLDIFKKADLSEKSRAKEPDAKSGLTGI